MNYIKTNITFAPIFHAIFQQLNMNEMDIDVNDLNESISGQKHEKKEKVNFY